MSRNQNFIASIGLSIGAIFGISGSFFEGTVAQIVLYEVSSIGLTAACALLTIKFQKEGKDYSAAGFLLLAIGEAVMTVGSALGPEGGQPSFAAGMALYIPAFLFISIPNVFPLWCRITGIAATIPFSIAAAKMFMGQIVPPTSALAGAGYGLLTLTIIGWVIALLREKSES